MNQVAEENFEKIKCSQIGTPTNMKNKSKKAKDRLSGEDELSEKIANTFHINSVSSNLTNGTSDYSNGRSPDDQEVTLAAQNEAPSEPAQVVNSVQCSDAPRDESKATAQHAINCIIDDALETLENALSKRDQSPHDDIEIISYESELQMPEIMRLIQKDLSEPYSIYTYRYFIHNWPKLCFLATHEGKCIGAIVCKLDMHRNVVKRGYIAMLAVDEKYRNKRIGSQLARKAIQVQFYINSFFRVLIWISCTQ